MSVFKGFIWQGKIVKERETFYYFIHNVQPQYYYSGEVIIISIPYLFYSGLILIHLIYLNFIINLALFIFKAVYSQQGIFTFIILFESLGHSLRLVRQVLIPQIFPRLREVRWLAQGHMAGTWQCRDSNFNDVIQANFQITSA